MKKIVLSALSIIILTTGATAADELFNYKQEIGVGVSYVDRSSKYWDNNYALNINGKLMKSLSETIAIGMTINIDYNPSVQLTSESSNPKEYMINFLPTVTYIVNDKIDVSAMLGYEFGKYDASWRDWDTKGLSYGLATSYAVTEQWRVNVQVLRTNLEFDGVDSTETVNTNCYTIGIGYNF